MQALSGVTISAIKWNEGYCQYFHHLWWLSLVQINTYGLLVESVTYTDLLTSQGSGSSQASEMLTHGTFTTLVQARPSQRDPGTSEILFQKDIEILKWIQYQGEGWSKNKAKDWDSQENLEYFYNLTQLDLCGKPVIGKALWEAKRLFSVHLA